MGNKIKFLSDTTIKLDCHKYSKYVYVCMYDQYICFLVNEWSIYIALYCVLLYTQSALQSCGGGVSPQPPPVCSIHLDDVTAATGQRHQCAHHTPATGGEEREIEPIKWMGIIRRPWLTRTSGGNLARTPGLHPYSLRGVKGFRLYGPGRGYRGHGHKDHLPWPPELPAPPWPPELPALPWPPELPAPPWPPELLHCHASWLLPHGLLCLSVPLWRSPSCVPVRVCPEGPPERPPPLPGGTVMAWDTPSGRGELCQGSVVCVICSRLLCPYWFVSCPCFMSLWVNSCPAVLSRYVLITLCILVLSFEFDFVWSTRYSRWFPVHVSHALSCPALMSY